MNIVIVTLEGRHDTWKQPNSTGNQYGESVVNL